jgi:predicted Holliday junction resolvase-like endonuclease
MVVVKCGETVVPVSPFPRLRHGGSNLQNVIIALVGLSVLLLLLAMHYKRKVDAMADLLEDERSRQRSLSTVYGRISEQWFPLMDRYPYDSQSFRFLGTPVDGIQFEEDRIVFCEFKANQSTLSPLQKQIKRLVETKQVYWEEFNFTPD